MLGELAQLGKSRDTNIVAKQRNLFVTSWVQMKNTRAQELQLKHVTQKELSEKRRTAIASVAVASCLGAKGCTEASPPCSDCSPSLVPTRDASKTTQTVLPVH